MKHSITHFSRMLHIVILLLLVDHGQSTFTDVHCVGNTSVIVHLFEWKWKDIENECSYLAQAGYCAVQTSVVTENKYEVSRPWWERYQPVTYKIVSRSGSEDEFSSMVRTCNSVGVRIINDVVINHMARGGVGLGVAGSMYNGTALLYPGVPYNSSHFHTVNDCSDPSNQVTNGSSSDDLRHCQLLFLPDLDQSQDYVRSKIINLLDRLVDHGSVGFRVDAAKHIHPDDLKYIYENVKDVAVGGRPVVINEVVNTIPDAITSDEYYPLGLVTEFRYSEMVGEALSQKDYSTLCDVFQTLLKEENALLFIDNHDTQRGRERPGSVVLTYKTPELYKRAQAFTLAAGYGTQRVMSSYYFQDTEAGPPADNSDHILDVVTKIDGTCGNGWVCEHRWQVIQKTVQFNNLMKGFQMNNCQATQNTVSFMRGDDTLFWMTSDDTVTSEKITTNLTDGRYCDLMSDCKSKYIVDSFGMVTLTSADDGIVVLVPDLSTTDASTLSITDSSTLSTTDSSTLSTTDSSTVSSTDNSTMSSINITVSTSDSSTVSTPDSSTVSTPDSSTVSTSINNNNTTTVASSDNSTMSTNVINTVSTTDTNSVSTTDKNSVSTTDKNSVSTTDTNSVSTTDTNSVSTTDTNSVSTTDTNSVSTTDTNSVSTTDTNTVSTPVSTIYNSTDATSDTNTVSTTVNSVTSVSTTSNQTITTTTEPLTTQDLNSTDHTNTSWTTDVTWSTPNATVPWNVTESTVAPGPDWHRTVILLEKQTSPGQDVFLRGGIDRSRISGDRTCETYDFEHNPCVIPIKHRPLEIREPTPARDAWSVGDNYLDWYGPEPNQGKQGTTPSQGTPGQWTSSNPSGKYYDPLNTFGDHYWIVDVDMDCSRTFQGFFEFKGVLSNGWEFGPSLDSDCTGDGATQFPYHAGNHIGRCGFINVYHWGTGLCEIHAFTSSSVGDSVIG